MPIAFIGTQIYFWGWYSEFFHRSSPLERTVVFATLFFFLYAALPLVKAMRELAPLSWTSQSFWRMHSRILARFLFCCGLLTSGR